MFMYVILVYSEYATTILVFLWDRSCSMVGFPNPFYCSPIDRKLNSDGDVSSYRTPY
jgi:hypothetical protein